MLSVSEAQSIVLNHTQTPAGDVEALTSALLGHVLAEPVTADLDSPPFDKSMMDGFAVRASDCATAESRLRVVGEVTAGSDSVPALDAGTAVRIMTGAPIPDGADAVVMKERCRDLDDAVVIDPVEAGTNILRRGSEMQAGQVVLDVGTRLRAPEFGLLAAVGRTTVSVYPAPRVSVIATGDELVEANMTPRAGQIRNSNGPMLVMQAVQAGALPRYLGIARDEPNVMRSLIREGLEGGGVVILSGGVSAGSYDLVPSVLTDLGVETHFHKVAMKPGKPILFGTRGDVLVFGLPGNPVSSFVCFELFVRPALNKLRGESEPIASPISLPLAESLRYNSDRPTYYPAKRRRSEHGIVVEPVPWIGSADLKSVTRTDALILLPAGESDLPAGQSVSVLALE